MDIVEGEQRQQATNAQKKLAVIERKSEFPGKVREAIDEWKEENPEIFLSKIESKLLNLLLENTCNGIDEIKGLNYDCDTEKEIETAIRFFPNVLSTREVGEYHIYWLSRNWRGHYNLKAASFIPLFAKLAVEPGQFEEEERGGLISGGCNVLEILATSFDYNKNDSEERRRLVDETFLAVMKKLREHGLFKKEDILEYDMTRNLCTRRIFLEQRFRYLTDWNPDCLTKTPFVGRDDDLPIHCAINYCKDFHGFLMVFQAGMRHFPTKIGLLFHKDEHDRTAYQLACKTYGKEEVDKMIKGVINIQEYNIAETLIYAATKDKVHLDGVYTIFRREPSMLL